MSELFVYGEYPRASEVSRIRIPTVAVEDTRTRRRQAAFSLLTRVYPDDDMSNVFAQVDQWKANGTEIQNTYRRFTQAIFVAFCNGYNAFLEFQGIQDAHLHQKDVGDAWWYGDQDCTQIMNGNLSGEVEDMLRTASSGMHVSLMLYDHPDSMIWMRLSDWNPVITLAFQDGWNAAEEKYGNTLSMATEFVPPDNVKIRTNY